jgi:hypothetical protein
MNTAEIIDERAKNLPEPLAREVMDDDYCQLIHRSL